MLDLRVDAAAAVVDGAVRPASIGVLSGRIVTLAPDAPSHRVVTYGPDLLVLPGLVDTHVHVNEPGHTEWEGFVHAGRAAAAGGVTTLVDMPLDSSPVTTTVAALAAKRSAAEVAGVEVGFWGGLVPGNLGSLRGLAAAGVLGFKTFLADSGNPEFPPVSAAELEAGMAVAADVGLPVLVHAESGALLTAAAGPGYAGFLASRPDAAEADAVRTVVEAVRRTGARAHIVHVSSAAVLPLLREAKLAGLPVTAETCPHYLVLSAEEIPDGATEFACCPPVRSAANAEALWDALADGTLDMVVSDHSPAPAADKLTGDFGTAWGRHQFAAAGPAGDVVDRARRPGGGRDLDERRAGAAGRARRPRGDRRRQAGRPVRLRPVLRLDGRPGPVAPPATRHALRRADADRTGRRHLARRHRGNRVRILVINPNTSEEMTAAIAKSAEAAASPGTSVTTVQPAFGPRAIDSAAEAYIAAAAVMDLERGIGPDVDAVVLAGFGEPGRDGLAELLDVPVLDICTASAQVALMLGRSYSVVTTLQRSVAMIEDRLESAGLLARCASVRACGWSTAQVDADPSGSVAAILAEAEIAVRDEHAEVICLGCGGMAGLPEAITASLGVPVVDGVAAAVRLAEAVVGLGLRTSKVCTYAAPEPNELVEWPRHG